VRNGKIIVAILIAIAGLLVAGRALMRGVPSTKHEAVNHEVSLEVQQLVTGGFDTYPTTETVEAVIEDASARVSTAVQNIPSSVLPKSKHEDLTRAFHGLFSSIVAPDVERDEAWKVSRGKKPMGDLLTPEVRVSMQESAEYFALPRMNLSEIEIIPVYVRGVVQRSSATDDGFGINTTRLVGAYPISDDPEHDKLDVVEVRFPMEVPDPREGGRVRVSIGFQFAWSREREQWIPFGNVSYHDPNVAIVAPAN